MSFGEEKMHEELNPIHPTNDTVYAIVGAKTSGSIFTGKASGLYRSDDGGASWQAVLQADLPGELLPVASAALSPSFDQDHTVIAGLPGGAARSTNGGTTWQFLPFQPPPPYFTALAFSPEFLTDGTILGGTSEDGFLRTENTGDSWVHWNFGLLDLEIISIAVSPNFSQDETLFLGTSSGIFRSTNGGRAWKEMNLPCGPAAVLSIAFGTDNPDMGMIVYAGTEENGLYISVDCGKTWQVFADGDLSGSINMLVTSPPGKPACLGVLMDDEVLIQFGAGTAWKKLQIPADQGQVSAIFPPEGLGPDLPLLVGTSEGEIIRLERLQKFVF